jgi:HlyD family secretion protein
MSTKKKIIIGSIAVVVLIAAIIISISATRKNRVTVQTGKVSQKETLESRVNASGEIRPKNYVELQAEIVGVITHLSVKEGDRVNKGDVLLRIDPLQSEADLRAQQASVEAQTYDASNIQGQIAIAEANKLRDQANLDAARSDLKQAENDMERARAKFKRLQQLHEENLLSKEDYDAAKNDLAIVEAKLTSARSAVRRAEAQVNVSQVTLRQAQQQHHATLSRLSEGKAMLFKTQDLLSKTVLRSPLTGVITKLNVEAGERAVPGTLNNPSATLMIIADLSVIEAEIKVDETDIVHVKVGQPAKVTVDALQDTPLKGVVTEVGSSALQTGTLSSQQQQQSTQQAAKDFKVVVQLTDPPASLRPGLSATAEITTATKHNVLTVPIQALTIREVDVDGKGNYLPPKRGDKSGVVSANSGVKTKKKELQGVFVVSKDGKAVFRPVETGITGQTDIEVKNGLSSSEEIVTGSYKTLRSLKDGDAVKIDNSTKAKTEEKS